MKTRRTSIQIEDVKNNIGSNKQIVEIMLQKMPESAIKYNTLLIQLKTKEEGFIKNNYI